MITPQHDQLPSTFFCFPVKGPFDHIADLTRRVMDGGIMRFIVTARPLKIIRGQNAFGSHA